jgi:hypothetical protein
MHNACMTTIQIRDVPDDVRDELARRAQSAHQSLQQYMLSMLIAEARKQDVASIWERAANRARLAGSECGFQDVSTDVREFRERGRPT